MKDHINLENVENAFVKTRLEHSGENQTEVKDLGVIHSWWILKTQKTFR